MATIITMSAYAFLEALIRYFEKKNTDIKIINQLKECKDLKFMNEIK